MTEPFFNLGKLSEGHRRLMISMGNGYIGLNCVVHPAIVFQNDLTQRVNPEITYAEELANGAADIYNPTVTEELITGKVQIADPLTGLAATFSNVSLVDKIDTEWTIVTLLALNVNDKITVTYSDDLTITFTITEALASSSFSQVTNRFLARLVC